MSQVHLIGFPSCLYLSFSILGFDCLLYPWCFCTGRFFYTLLYFTHTSNHLDFTFKPRSRQPDSLESTAVVAISVEESLLPVAVRAGGDGSAASWLAGVLVAILLVAIVIGIAVFFFCRKRLRKDQQRKFGGQGQAQGQGRGQVNAGMNASDSMELSSNGTSSVTNLSRFPPQYSEIIADYDTRNNPKQQAQAAAAAAAKQHHQGLVGNSRSEISEKSHRSASSGRGSVEDCDEEVDSEIRDAIQ